MRVTRNNISEAIKVRTGYDVTVEGTPKEGCYHFCSEDLETDKFLSGTIYVCFLTQLSIEQWVDEFQFMLNKFRKEL